MPKPPLLLIVPVLALLLMLCSGCANVTPQPLPVVVQRLPLPAEARQPATEPECVPDCSAGLGRLLDDTLPLRMPAAPPARPASGSLTGK